MKLPHLSMLCLAASAVLSTTPAHALTPLSGTELEQVHAAGLPDLALSQLVVAALPPGDVAHDTSAALDRQQQLAQVRFASTTGQASLGLMRSATLPTLFTPLAPLFLPALAMPFPFLMAPLPKKH